jgi:hypothetical protein
MKKLLIIALVSVSFLKPAFALLPPTILVDVWAMFGQIFALVAALFASSFMSIYFAMRHKIKRLTKKQLILIVAGLLLLAGVVAFLILTFLI